MVPSKKIAKSMPTLANIEAFSQAPIAPNIGKKWIINLKLFVTSSLVPNIVDVFPIF